MPFEIWQGEKMHHLSSLTRLAPSRPAASTAKEKCCEAIPTAVQSPLNRVVLERPRFMSIETDITQTDFKAFVRHVTVGSDGGRSMYILLIGSAIVMGVVLGIALAFASIRLHVARAVQEKL